MPRTAIQKRAGAYLRRYRRYKKRKHYSKSKKNFRPARGIKRQIVPLTRIRQFSGTLRSLTTLPAADAWTETTTLTQQGLVKTLAFHLDQLPGIGDIGPLFKEYRIMAVRMEIIPATTTTNISPAAGNSNSGLYLRARQNRTGVLLTSADAVTDWNQNMAVKRFKIPSNRSTILYMPLNQLAFTYRGNPIAPPGNYSYTVQRPRWVDSSDLGLVHYGLDLRIDSLDGQNISNHYGSSPAFTILYKYYFMCRGIQ